MKFRVAAMALSLLLSGCSLTVGPTTMVAPTTTVAPSASVGMTEAEVTTNHPPTTTPTSGSPTGPEWEALARSVVFIYVDDCGGYSWTGSGTIVLDGGYVFTNAHVVADDADNFCHLMILAADSASELPNWIADARVIPEAYDFDVDLAVLRLVDADGQPVLAAGRSPVEIKNLQLGLGDEIKVLGYPGLGGDTITMTGGEISGWMSDDGRTFYKSSARSGPGISGGAAFGAATGEYAGTPTGGTTDDVGEALVLIRRSSYALPLLQAAQQADLPPAPTTTSPATPSTLAPIEGLGAPTIDTSSSVSTVGIDRIMFGMTLDAAQVAAGTLFIPVTPLGECFLAAPADAPPGITFWIVAGIVERVDIDNPAITTRSGAGIGYTEDRIREMFGERIHTTLLPDGSGNLLAYVPKDVAQATQRVMFLTDGVQVTRFWGGRLPWVEELSGCPSSPTAAAPTTTVPPPSTTPEMFGNLGPQLVAMLLGQPCIADGDLSDCGPEVSALIQGLVGE